MFKKLLYTLFIILIVIALLIAGLLIYIKPERELDWSYSKVSLTDKAKQMITSFKTELNLSEEEINNLLKEQLADKAKLPNDTEITGMQFDLQGSTAFADVNLLWKGLVEAGAQIKFDLEWKEGTLMMKHSQTNVKAISIPATYFKIPDVEIPINKMLPKMVAIKDLSFEPDHIHIKFKLNF
jgi:hypothetical protein